MSDNKCNLCKKCVGICRKIVGRNAISYVEDEKGEASIVFSQDKCIACGSCCFICDSGAVTMKDNGDTRIIDAPSGEMVFNMSRCKNCGDYWIPFQQLEYMTTEANLPIEAFDLCHDCRE